MTKMTRVEAINYVTDNYDIPADVAEVLNKIKVSFEKKSTNRKPTATQVANEGVKDIIRNVLSDGKARTVSEVIADGAFTDTVTPQKISALMTLLIKAGEVVKTMDKRKSYFSLVEDKGDSEVQALDREITV